VAFRIYMHIETYKRVHGMLDRLLHRHAVRDEKLNCLSHHERTLQVGFAYPVTFIAVFFFA
jgi:hypothetical protein